MYTLFLKSNFLKFCNYRLINARRCGLREPGGQKTIESKLRSKFIDALVSFPLGSLEQHFAAVQPSWTLCEWILCEETVLE